MLKQVCIAAVLFAAFAAPSYASRTRTGSDVSVEIVDANGASFEQFPVRSDGKAWRAYLQAKRDARYRIRVSNKTGERVGVVIAVDGRNVITGARSDLARNESMYVLAPWESNEYSGWRTSMQDVHEFYFTDWQDSYAEAFGDASARGVIAVAVYREKDRPMLRKDYRGERESERQQAPAAASGRPHADELARKSEPGTGFGDQRYEPVTRVAFEAARNPSSRIFLKYEWQETLCRKRIARCAGDESNRFWNDDLAFAPFPPRR